ncbi:putative nicotinamide nmethyltransferase [Paratrimastix pyriformis]|uniref:Nicotinamide nmethyltransferase n=1 Tax=Paratrimastix pyriformis TaxID=342808 RepID=A0ABQ8UNT9_9EUKA|nr:putative nicotinamide nmethyltransferase [Paratrimastix pyriformis]
MEDEYERRLREIKATPADEQEEAMIGLFQEPDGYYKEPIPPTFSSYHRKASDSEPADVRLRVPGEHPLWAHRVWNAAMVLADYIDMSFQIKGRRVLELGAGAALPSLISAFKGAEKLAITDYPDEVLIENIRMNLPINNLEEGAHIRVQGHCFGEDPASLMDFVAPARGYDLILTADVVFNHSCHRQLLTTCKRCLAQDGTGEVYVSFSHHVARKVALDMNLFALACAEFGFRVEALFKVDTPPAFEVDVGDPVVRSGVYMYRLTLASHEPPPVPTFPPGVHPMPPYVPIPPLVEQPVH